MTTNSLDDLLERQRECVAVWQLTALGWTRARIAWALRDLRPVDRVDGVHTTARGALSRDQRWQAATLSAPGTFLAGISAALLGDFGDRRGTESFIVVVRHGTGGPRRVGDLLVTRSTTALTTAWRGIPTITPAQALMDLAPHLDDAALRRALIEAIRLRRTTVEAVRERLPGRRGAPRLRALLELVEDLPIARTRSNAEGTALVRLKLAGEPIPKVNAVVAGYELDQFDPATGEAVEIDGPAFHADTIKDAERDARLAARGIRVRRRPSGDAYDPAADWRA